jgi:hypothetical protein
VLSKRIIALGSVATLILIASSTSGQTTAATEPKMIGDARAAYYNVTRHGFNGFQATIKPDWKVILAEAATRENLKVFRALRFSMVSDANGTITVNREFGQLNTSVTQIHNHLERLLSGFFATWAFFTIGGPFPEVPIRIENIGKGFHFLYRVQSTDAMLSIGPDFLISEVQLSDSSSKRTITPVFERTPEGLILLGYHNTFEPLATGVKTTIDTTIEYRDIGEMKLPSKIHILILLGYHNTFEPLATGVKTTIDTMIEYRDIGEMKLPSKIHIKGTYGAERVEASLSFTEYALVSNPNH